MLGNFMYCNPMKLYFGEDSLASLNEELPKYRQNVQLVYGGGPVCGYVKAVSHLRSDLGRKRPKFPVGNKPDGLFPTYSFT